MITTFGRISCCKVYRNTGDLPRLDFDRISQNMLSGHQTQLTLDTNVVISMTKCCDPDEPAEDLTLERHGLLDFVEFLRNCDRHGFSYHISPYFALMEMPECETSAAIAAIEAFPTKFGLNWIDDSHSPIREFSSVGRRARTDRYLTLNEDERRFMAQHYGGLLLLLLVARDFSTSTPYAQFATFLRLSQSHLSIVSSRLLQIARFVLAPAPHQGEEIYGLWRDIVLNFTQREKPTQRYPTSFHQIDKAAMNGSHDLMVLDAVLFAEGRGLAGIDVDPWIVTGDRKLASMLRSIHHVGISKGQAGMILAAEEMAHHGEYWARTEKALKHRNSRFVRNVDIDRLENQALSIRSFAQNNIRCAIDFPASSETYLLVPGRGVSA